MSSSVWEGLARAIRSSICLRIFGSQALNPSGDSEERVSFGDGGTFDIGRNSTILRMNDPVLIYDGRCNFCRRQAEHLLRLSGGRLRLESFRDPGVLARYPRLTLEACEQAMQLVEPDGRISSAAEAS